MSLESFGNTYLHGSGGGNDLKDIDNTNPNQTPIPIANETPDNLPGTGTETTNPDQELNNDLSKTYWENERKYLLGILETGTSGAKIWANNQLYLVNLVLYGTKGQSTE